MLVLGLPWLRPNVVALSKKSKVSALIGALHFKRDAKIRASAATALGELGRHEALEQLRDAALHDTEPDVRQAAELAVQRLQAHDEVLPEPLAIDVAIVGGGIGGCYAAFRLTDPDQDGRRESVHLFEAQQDLGGRVLSLRLSGVPCPAELGPMRFGSGQQRINDLITKKLDLDRKKHFFGYPTRYYLRGQVLPDLESHKPWGAFDLSGNRGNRNERLQQILDLYKDKQADIPDGLVAYGVAECLRHVRMSEDFSRTNPVLAKDINTALENLKPEAPDWSAIKKGYWGPIKEHGVIHLPVGGGETLKVDLYKTGFWNVLQHFLGNEGFLLVHDAGGYESVYGNWNAAEAVKWDVDEFQKQDYWMPTRGFKAVIDELAKRASDAGCTIHPGHVLTHIRVVPGSVPDAPPQWDLTVEATSRDGAKGLLRVRARSVILALPRGALERLQVDDPQRVLRTPDSEHDPVPWRTLDAWQRFSRRCLSAVSQQRLFKMFLLYSHPWWQDGETPGARSVLGFDKGRLCDTARVNTDLPIRQVYYFGPTWMEQHTPTDATPEGQLEACHLPGWGVIMASYSDGHYVDFWGPFGSLFKHQKATADTLFEDEGNENAWKDLKEKLGAEQYDDLVRTLTGSRAAPRRMVHKVRRQLADLHGIAPEDCPKPLGAVCIDWGEQEHIRAGWHTWEINRKAWQIAESVRKPFQGADLYICGEAYSHHQGWIEGTLETTDEVLKDGFRLGEPTWLRNDANVPVTADGADIRDRGSQGT